VRDFEVVVEKQSLLPVSLAFVSIVDPDFVVSLVIDSFLPVSVLGIAHFADLGLLAYYFVFSPSLADLPDIEEWQIGYFAFPPVSLLETAHFADLGSPVYYFVFSPLIDIGEWRADFALFEQSAVGLEIESNPLVVTVGEWQVDYSVLVAAGRRP
jgi:hypothetical protein